MRAKLVPNIVAKMEDVEGQTTPIFEDKSFDETTLFAITQDGSVTKRRRRKSLGRRVSFAEAPPSLHIFPRDDEYETPSRGNAGSSPHRVGERRSPRLASKRVDADKENRDLSYNAGFQRKTRRSKKPLADRGGGSPALKPLNWLDARDSSSEPGGDDEENTGPVDLRHLSSDQKESDMDDDNITLDSTTFALKFSQQKNKNPLPETDQADEDEPSVVHTGKRILDMGADEADEYEPSVVHTGKRISDMGVGEGSPDADLLHNDMSFVTINRPLPRQKPVTELQTVLVEMSSDMSLTIPFPRPQRKPSMSPEGNGPDDNLRISMDQRMALPATMEDSSTSGTNSPVAENCQGQMHQSLDVSVQIERQWLAELGKGAMKGAGTNSPDAENCQGQKEQSLDVSVQMERQWPTEPGRGVIVRGVSEENLEDTETMDMSVSSLSISSIGHGDRSITMGIPSLRYLIRAEEEDAEMGEADVAFTGAHRAMETHSPPEDENMTEVVFTGFHRSRETDSLPKNADVRADNVVSVGSQRARETESPQQHTGMGMTEIVSTGAQKARETNSPPEVANIGMTDVVQEEMPRAEEIHTPREDAATKLKDVVSTEVHYPPVDEDVRVKDVVVTGMQMAKETLSPLKMATSSIEDAKMRRTEETHSSIDGDVSMKEVVLTGMQMAKETLSPLKIAKASIQDARMRRTEETHSPIDVDVRMKEVVLTGLQMAKESLCPLKIANAAIEVATMRRTEETHSPIDVDVRMKEVVLTGLQMAKESLSPLKIANAAIEVATMRRTEETHSPIYNDVRIKDVVWTGMQLAKETLSPLKISNAVVEVATVQRTEETHNAPEDADMRFTDEMFTGMQRRRESDCLPDVASTGMTVAVFKGKHKAEDTHSPLQRDREEFDGPDCEVQALKRTKFVRDSTSVERKELDSLTSSRRKKYPGFDNQWMVQDNHFSPAQDSLTAQVPRFSDLLAADMNGTDLTPAWNYSSAIVSPRPSSLSPGPYDGSDEVLLSNPAREDGGSSPSPFDSSMEIVDGTNDPSIHSIRVAPMTASQEHIKMTAGFEPNQGSVSSASREVEDRPHILASEQEKEGDQDTFALRESMDPAHILKTSQENKDGFLTSPRRRETLQVPKSHEVHSEQDRPASRQMTDPTDIISTFQDTLTTGEAIKPTQFLSTAQEKESAQIPLTIPSQKVTLQVKSPHEKDYEQDPHYRKETIDPLPAAQGKEIEQGALTSLRHTVTLQLRNTQGNDYEQNSTAVKELVDPTEILSTGLQIEQDTLMSRRQRVPSQLIETEQKVGQDSLLTGEPIDSTHILKISPAKETERGVLSRLGKSLSPQLDTVNQKNDFSSPEVTVKLKQVKPAHILYKTQEDGEVGINVRKMSVDEFLQLAEVHFSLDFQSPKEILKDPSLAETHQIRSLSESFNFLCLVKPQLHLMRDACEDLYEEVDRRSTSVEKLEERLTASNPAIFSYLQRAPEWEKQRMRKQLQRVRSNCRLLAGKDWFHFQQKVELDYSSRLLEMKNSMLYYAQLLQERRNTFDEECGRFVRLQDILSSKNASRECTSMRAPEESNVGVNIREEVDLKRIEDLEERVKTLDASKELKLAKLIPRRQAAEDTLRGLQQKLDILRKNLSALRSQVVDKVCMGQKNLGREEVARRPHVYVKKLKDRVCLLHNIQDGFRVQSAGRENLDLVVELSYRSVVTRRFVVRKLGDFIKVMTSSWVLESEKINEMFPGVNAMGAFRLALMTTYGGVSKPANNLRAWTQMFGRVFALEALRFALPTAQNGGIPEPTCLRASMQVSRILLGNLMELMDEVRKCQLVVNTSCGGGVLAEPRFRNEAGTDGRPQLEVKIIDCVLSIKFFVILDMSCLPLNGYPLGALPAEVEIIYCAPPARHLFKKETLEGALAGVKPGYRRLVRTFRAVGALLESLRKAT